MPEAKRKTHTSTEVKRRYNEKTYTLISASVPKETAAALKPFSVYGQAARKYCSHACYILHRFGGGADE